MQAELELERPPLMGRISFHSGLALAAGLAVVHLALLCLPSSSNEIALLRRAVLVVDNLLAAIALFYAARHSALFSRHLYTAWSVLALAQAVYALGDVTWGAALLVARAGPFLSTSIILYALYYPLFLAGILLFPFPSRLARHAWLRLMLDVGIVLLGCILLAWTFLIGPLLDLPNAPQGLALAKTLAYPAADLVLLLALLGLLLRQTAPQRHEPLLLLGAAGAVLVLTHANFVYQAVANGTTAHVFLDLGLGSASLLAGLAGLLQATLPPALHSNESDAHRKLTPWQLYLPYLSLGVSYVLLVWRHSHAAAIQFTALAGGVGGIIALMLIRQVAAFTENARLYDQWRYAQEELEQRVAERTADLAQINQDLQAEMHSNARLFVSLQETNQQLLAAMAAKDEMLQNVSHELRTPLMLILGYVELLHNDELGPLEHEQAEAVAIVLRQGERLRFMVNRLLTLQTFEAGKLRLAPLHVEPWIQQTADAWQVRAAQTGLALSTIVAPGLPAIDADRDFLGQVLENLLDNAVKFTPQGGHVSIRSWAEPGRLLLAVVDDGVGIPPDRLDQVFDRFYQVDGSTNRRFSGMGIGLALCRAIVEAHGGSIWAESAGEGRGTVFYIALPLTGQQILF